MSSLIQLMSVHDADVFEVVANEPLNQTINIYPLPHFNL